MMFTTILGNIKETEHTNLECETITVPSDYLQKKVIRVISNMQNEYGIDLKDSGCTLEDGAVFYKNEQKIIFLKVNEDKCIVVKPSNIAQMGLVAHYLGNMHMPVEIEEDTIILHYDKFLEEDLTAKHVHFSVEYKKLNKALKHVEFGHKH